MRSSVTVMRAPTLTMLLCVTAWWLLSAMVWSGQVLAMANTIGQSLSWRYVLRTELASALLWIPATLFLFACVRHTPFESGRIARAAIWLSLAVLAVVVFRALAVAIFNPVIGWYRDGLPSPLQLLYTSLLNNLLMCWLIIGVAHGLIYAEREARRRRRTDRLGERLARARLAALSARLNPHFLFNTLNSIAELVHRDADAADRLLVALGALLRRNLDNHTAVVALSDELELLEHYVEIERTRLGSRLIFTCDVPADIRGTPVPSLVLQPLVENAIRYAIAPRPCPGHVSVMARRSDDRLLLEVRDDGDGAPEVGRGNGVGLRAIHARLRCLYGSDYSFRIVHDAAGALARLDLPLRSAMA